MESAFAGTEMSASREKKCWEEEKESQETGREEVPVLCCAVLCCAACVVLCDFVAPAGLL